MATKDRFACSRSVVGTWDLLRNDRGYL